MMTMGLAVEKRPFIRCGTATPTKEMGPAKAVTQPERMLESRISRKRNTLMFTPMFWA